MAWMFVGGEEGDLYLSYLDAGYLVISKGRTLHETVPLFNGKYWLRGVAKGDSMMIVCKVKVHAEKITGEVTASQMVQAVTKEIELPRAYQHTNIPVNQIKNLLFLCLCDPNFPAFVRQVRKALHEME
ncbi:uncharacterized protein LOC143252960 isoform X5 [Tachypleus tridentatus]|uniref:uncharacterized protein LOC143252960 isoform X5 n=1 Tax=Tachypleus tridentatus TaxID=6853 RepID=UPI003FD1130D